MTSQRNVQTCLLTEPISYHMLHNIYNLFIVDYVLYFYIIITFF